jgi:hypothetical protein
MLDSVSSDDVIHLKFQFNTRNETALSIVYTFDCVFASLNLLREDSNALLDFNAF